MVGAVYLTGVLEYLAAELMELAGNAAKEVNKKRITPRHVESIYNYPKALPNIIRGRGGCASGLKTRS